MTKIKSVGTIKEFMAGEHNKTWIDRKVSAQRIEKWMKVATGLTIPVTVMTGIPTVGFASPAVATMSMPSVTSAITKAFDPLIQLIVSLSYPIAGIMIAGGCLMILVGMKDKGTDMLRNAAIGYILVQLSPLLLKILVGVGTGVM